MIFQAERCQIEWIRSHDQGTSTVVTANPKVAYPPMYRVLMLNDDYTPMDFVVEILARIFRMPLPEANRTMERIHTKGSAVCGVYTLEIAETKVNQVTEIARRNQHPLRCEIEEGGVPEARS